MDLIDYIKKKSAEGQTAEQIFSYLLEKGYTVKGIQSAYGSLEKHTDTIDSRHRATQSILILGVFLIGAGIFSFIASNWQELSRFGKVFIIISLMIISYSTALLFHFKYHFYKTAHALFFLGVLIYGSGIFLIGQIFHISAHWPDGFLLWMIGALLLDFVYRSTLIRFFSLIVGFIALFSHPYSIMGAFSGYNTALITSVFVIGISVAVSFYCALLMRGVARKKFTLWY